MENKIDREVIVDMLREGVVRVSFTKKDGDTRNMRCTLAQDLIPENMQPKGTAGPVSESVVRVYDVDAEGWRSFVVANVHSVEVAQLLK